MNWGLPVAATMPAGSGRKSPSMGAGSRGRPQMACAVSVGAGCSVGEGDPSGCAASGVNVGSLGTSASVSGSGDGGAVHAVPSTSMAVRLINERLKLLFNTFYPRKYPISVEYILPVLRLLAVCHSSCFCWPLLLGCRLTQIGGNSYQHQTA